MVTSPDSPSTMMSRTSGAVPPMMATRATCFGDPVGVLGAGAGLAGAAARTAAARSASRGRRGAVGRRGRGSTSSRRGVCRRSPVLGHQNGRQVRSGACSQHVEGAFLGGGVQRLKASRSGGGCPAASPPGSLMVGPCPCARCGAGLSVLVARHVAAALGAAHGGDPFGDERVAALVEVVGDDGVTQPFGLVESGRVDVGLEGPEGVDRNHGAQDADAGDLVERSLAGRADGASLPAPFRRVVGEDRLGGRLLVGFPRHGSSPLLVVASMAPKYPVMSGSVTAGCCWAVTAVTQRSNSAAVGV